MTDEKQGRNAPRPRSVGGPRNKVLQVGLTQEVYALVQSCAAEYGVSASAWAAMVVGKAAQMQKREMQMHSALSMQLAQMMAEGADGDDA